MIFTTGKFGPCALGEKSVVGRLARSPRLLRAHRVACLGRSARAARRTFEPYPDPGAGYRLTATELAIADPANPGPAAVRASGRVAYASADRAVRALEHLWLVTAAMGIALLIGLPVGVALVRRSSLRRWVLGAANVVQTIPSLALFGFLIPVPFLGGIGANTAIVALMLYALLPILRNTYTGIAGVDPSVLEAARAMGMTPRQILWQIELPLAMGVILAGVRVATVLCIGVATIAAAVGAGGLGVFIFRGVAMVNNSVILAGAIPAALLAIAADLLLGAVERKLTPAQ